MSGRARHVWLFALALTATVGLSSCRQQATEQPPGTTAGTVGGSATTVAPPGSTTPSTQGGGPDSTPGSTLGSTPSQSTAPSSSPNSPPTTPSSGAPPSTPATTTDPADAAKNAATNAAYEQAYRAKCAQIWSIAPNGRLTDADDPDSTYTVNDCLSDLQQNMGEIYSTEAEAAQAGTDDAVTAAQSLAGELCYQTQCWNGT